LKLTGTLGQTITTCRHQSRHTWAARSRNHAIPDAIQRFGSAAILYAIRSTNGFASNSYM